MLCGQPSLNIQVVFILKIEKRVLLDTTIINYNQIKHKQNKHPVCFLKFNPEILSCSCTASHIYANEIE